MAVEVRDERDDDRAAIHHVNAAAFGQEDEAALVDRLREDGDVLLSLVAEVDGAVVGHVLFSRLLVETAAGGREAVALAPAAVLPAHQRRGIGAALIRAGLDRLRARSASAVFVLGDPAYYGRFGFLARLAEEFDCAYACEAFQALELSSGALAALRGRIRYPVAFSS